MGTGREYFSHIILSMPSLGWAQDGDLQLCMVRAIDIRGP
jgi:hypothetical protein